MHLFKMDLCEVHHNEGSTGEASMEYLLFTDLRAKDSMYEEQPIPPRVGDEYQVEIPSLVTESKCLQLRKSLISTNDVPTIDHPTTMRLSIPIIWVHHVHHHMQHELKETLNTMIRPAEPGSLDSEKNEEIHIDSKCNGPNGYPLGSSDHHDVHPQASSWEIEFSDDQLNHGGVFIDSTNQECTLLGEQKANVCSPLPGSSVVPWSEAEKEIFLLGLYIFGKNLVQVRNFVGSKKMGDILSYYYGWFYRSNAHCRWSECRKSRSRKCIHGQRLFTGWRQHELLSRLLPNISKEVHDTLLEATRTFNGGRVSLEDFVSMLKATVGVQVLVEAIGIGKGKHDLTGLALDPVRSNHSVSTRHEIPIGKACSSLTARDIIKFLTGDFRISKSRSNDLFWEAVWPRLLAQGWHSEQPKDLRFLGPKNGLVFLIPGVKKFTKRKLVKGNHYFNSISDVLNKVALDPRLLDLDVDKECAMGVYAKSDQNGLPDHQRHCYLRPRLPSCNEELTKFTVVDTSLVQGDAPFKVRELRSLPVDTASNHGPSTYSEETVNDTCDEQSESADVSLNNQGEYVHTFDHKKSGNKFELDRCYQFISLSKRGMTVNGKSSDDKYFDLLKQKQVAKDIKYQFSRRPKPGQPDSIPPVLKRQRLTACNNVDNNCRSDSYSRSHQLKKEQTFFEFKSHKVSDIGSEVGQAQEITSTSSSAKAILVDRSENIVHENFVDIGAISETRLLHEKTQPRTWLDLNFLPDSDAREPVCNEVVDSHDVLKVKASSSASERHEQLDAFQASGTSKIEPGNQQPTMNAQRQSTRNRPLTMKALEAFECGFLTTKRKWMGIRAPSLNNITSRRPRRARKNVQAPMPSDNSNLSAVGSNNLDIDIRKDAEYINTESLTRTFSKSHVQSERQKTHELFGVL